MTRSPITCDVCTDAHKTTVVCHSCDFSTCRACARRWVEETLGETGCPGCQRPWPMTELHARLGRSYVHGPYRRLRRAFYLRRELSLLSLSQLAATRERQRRMQREAMHEARRLVRESMADGGMPQALETVRRIFRALDVQNARAVRSTATPCAHEGCRSRAVDAQGVCALCSRRTCLLCGAARGGADDAHVCDPNDVETMRVVAAECRPCAQCSAPSMKTDGCDTMWCWSCHAFWNWQTGRLIPTRHQLPHNPDHRTFVNARLLGAPHREALDLQCGGLPDPNALADRIERLTRGAAWLGTDDPHFPELPLHMYYAARSAMSKVRLVYALHLDETKRAALRVRYLLGDFADDARFAAALERLFRGAEFQREVGQVLVTFVASVTDLLQRFCFDDACDFATLAASFARLRGVLNGALAVVGSDYARRVPRLDEAELRWR